MPIVVKFKVSGMPAEKYEEVHSRLDAAGSGAPASRLYHVSYGSPDNLQVIDVWESRQAFEAFGQQLVPVLQEMGIQAEPEIHDAYRVIQG